MKKQLYNTTTINYEEPEEIEEEESGDNRKIALKLVKKIFPDLKNDIVEFEEIHNGYTNISFVVSFKNGQRYQIRIPHDGKLINRQLEYDIHTKYLSSNEFIYFDKKTGIAIKKWISGEPPKKSIYKNLKFVDKLFRKIKQLHSIPLKKGYKLTPIKFDAYNENLYRLKFIYKKKFLCLMDRRSNDLMVLNHTDINPLNIIYNKDRELITLIDFEWAGLASDYHDYANYIRETGIDYKKIDWPKYIDNFKMETLEQYLFMTSVYSFLWTYAMPQTRKIIKYRYKTYKQIKKYYPACITVDKSCYINNENEK